MKRLKIALAVMAVALVGVMVWQARQPPDEPVYQGRPLSEWLKDETRMFGPETYGVVRQAGTNAIPTLLRMLRAKDSALKVKLMGLADKQHIIKIEYTPAQVWNEGAARGFAVLGTNAQSAVPSLIRIVDQNISSTSRYYAIMALGYIDPAAKETSPALLRWATNADGDVRHDAIHALGRIHAEADRVVPVLINALHDPNRAVRFDAAVALGQFGPDAKTAVPALVKLLNDPDEALRFFTTNTLKAIDPQAAAKAGVK